MHSQGESALSDKELFWEKRLEELVERKVAERFDRLQASIEQALGQVRTAPAAALADRATLVVFSGDMDRLMAAFVIATGRGGHGHGGVDVLHLLGLDSAQKDHRLCR